MPDRGRSCRFRWADPGSNGPARPPDKTVDRIGRCAYLPCMSETIPGTAPRRISWALVAAGLGFGALAALAVALWIYYGTAVFFEIVRAGIAACL